MVTDRSRCGRASRRSPRDGAITGRGLHLVSVLATDWGVDVSVVGKTVWATFVT